VSIVAMSSIFLTMQAGAALRAALHLQGPAARLISQHAQAAHYLAYIYVLFTAVLIVTFAAMRISGGMPTGLGIVDRLLSRRPIFTLLRVVLVLVSIGAGYMCFRTGDLGAKAVWQGRIQAARDGGPGGPGVADQHADREDDRPAQRHQRGARRYAQKVRPHPRDHEQLDRGHNPRHDQCPVDVPLRAPTTRVGASVGQSVRQPIPCETPVS
jgi:hypothetical protein